MEFAATSNDQGNAPGQRPLPNQPPLAGPPFKAEDEDEEDRHEDSALESRLDVLRELFQFHSRALDRLPGSTTRHASFEVRSSGQVSSLSYHAH